MISKAEQSRLALLISNLPTFARQWAAATARVNAAASKVGEADPRIADARAKLADAEARIKRLDSLARTGYARAVQLRKIPDRAVPVFVVDPGLSGIRSVILAGLALAAVIVGVVLHFAAVPAILVSAAGIGAIVVGVTALVDAIGGASTEVSASAGGVVLVAVVLWYLSRRKGR
jgi:hypothetical protein